MSLSGRLPSLRLSRAQLREYCGYVFDYLLPDQQLFGSRIAVLIEPICAFAVQDLSVHSMTLVEKLVSPDFDSSSVRDKVVRTLRDEDGSDLEQVLEPLTAGIYELGDNPLTYPNRRLGALVDSVEQGVVPLEAVRGLIHGHPTDQAVPSESDNRTLTEIAKRFERLGSSSVASVVIGLGSPSRLPAYATKGREGFIHAMMVGADTMQITCVDYQPRGPHAPTTVLLS